MRARRLLLTLAGLLSIVWAARGDPSASGDAQASPQEASAAPPVTVHIATTACGADAAEDAIPLLKSIAIHASERNKYVVHVFMSNGTEFPYIKVRWTGSTPCVLRPRCSPAKSSPEGEADSRPTRLLRAHA